jgi:hypothetical protein
MRGGARGLALTEGVVTGLFFMQQYRFLTIPQFAKVAKFSVYHAGYMLRGLEARNLIGFFGFTVIRGQGKTPKVYYLKRRGYEYLIDESTYSPEEIGAFIEPAREFTWTPQMYHRLKILDCFIALETQLRAVPHVRLVQTFLEYRRRQGTQYRETMDYVAEPESSATRIVPDGAFILENTETGRRALFVLEVDMGTERVTVRSSKEERATLYRKLQQYDSYLNSGNFAKTYAAYGEFRSFLVLFVTTNEERIANTRAAAKHLSERLHAYYRFATFAAVDNHFLDSVWASRSVSDARRYPLIGQGER